MDAKEALMVLDRVAATQSDPLSKAALWSVAHVLTKHVQDAEVQLGKEKTKVARFEGGTFQALQYLLGRRTREDLRGAILRAYQDSGIGFVQALREQGE
jgi:hypothetical protein